MKNTNNQGNIDLACKKMRANFRKMKPNKNYAC